jgi:hypothetical protein
VIVLEAFAGCVFAVVVVAGAVLLGSLAVNAGRAMVCIVRLWLLRRDAKRVARWLGRMGV